VFGDSLQNLSSSRQQIAESTLGKLLLHLQTSVQEEVTKIRKIKRSYDNALQKYESTLFRYSGLSRTKESSALREEAFVLHEARKCYIKNRFKSTNVVWISRKL
jgi:BAR domain of APPL family